MMEGRIEKAEAALAAAQEALADPEVANDGAEAARTEVDRLISRWEQLESRA